MKYKKTNFSIKNGLVKGASPCCCLMPNNDKLVLNIIFDEKIAKSFQNTEYYVQEQERLKNIVKIEEIKRELSTSKKEELGLLL